MSLFRWRIPRGVRSPWWTQTREVIVMIARGVSAADVEIAVTRASRLFFDGNVILNRSEVRGTRVRFTLRVRDSRGPGAHASARRRTVSACWHAHREVIAALLQAMPEGRVTTAVADYRGLSDFLETFPETAYDNIGSVFEPVERWAACECPPEPDPSTPRWMRERHGAVT